MRSCNRLPPFNTYRQKAHRSGVSLLEVLVSTTILVASVTAIMQVLNVGHNSQLSAVLDAEAILRCESMMGELLAGVRPLESSGPEPFEDDTNWNWTASVTDQGSTSLLEVEILVEHTPSAQVSNSSWSLKRYVRDPAIFMEREGGNE
ncbi:MAG: hypothetical protein MK102_11365 [Fuerstiella sp.]|nr:hypothetical protein [Fuerstiella sp.]